MQAKKPICMQDFSISLHSFFVGVWPFAEEINRQLNAQDSPRNLTKPRTQNTCLCRGSRFRMSPKPSKLPVDKHKTLMVTPAARSCERVGQKNIAFGTPRFLCADFCAKNSGVRKNMAPHQASSSGWATTWEKSIRSICWWHHILIESFWPNTMPSDQSYVLVGKKLSENARSLKERPVKDEWFMRHSALEGWHLSQHTTKSIILRAPQHNRYSNDSSCNLKFRDTLRKKQPTKQPVLFLLRSCPTSSARASVVGWDGH